MSGLRSVLIILKVLILILPFFHPFFSCKVGRTPTCVKTCDSQDTMSATWRKERSTVKTNEIVKTAAHRSESWCWRQLLSHVLMQLVCGRPKAAGIIMNSMCTGKWRIGRPRRRWREVETEMRTGCLQGEQRTNRNEWMLFFSPISLLLHFVLSLTKIKLPRHGSSTFYACQCSTEACYGLLPCPPHYFADQWGLHYWVVGWSFEFIFAVLNYFVIQLII
jgi:hypothetical protein